VDRKGGGSQHLPMGTVVFAMFLVVRTVKQRQGVTLGISKLEPLYEDMGSAQRHPKNILQHSDQRARRNMS
jgi:hypothetical protein